MTEDRERKEKVLHTRIPESLESEIKDRASRLGVSVSNLVRNILQNAVEMIDDIVADSATVARTAREATSPRSTRRGQILGWQRLTLERNALCERCNAVLAKGSEAHVSVLDGPGPREFRCETCVK